MYRIAVALGAHHLVSEPFIAGLACRLASGAIDLIGLCTRFRMIEAMSSHNIYPSAVRIPGMLWGM
jgi:hypothetical protein